MPDSKSSTRQLRPRCAWPATSAHFRRANAKTPAFRAGVSGLGSLTITYFHTGIRTIIGVESFHGPVRDGKGWDRLAMVIRQRGLLCWLRSTTNLGRSSNLELCVSHTRIQPSDALCSAKQTCYRIKPYGQLVSVS